MATNPSLRMVVEVVDGVWIVEADWLSEPVTGASWEDVYWAAVRAMR